ncbi:probable F-box protein At4g22030 [Pistacia vera]|uniref:probable F-box protein At4g22030 n=1 Tax=Pistacia vera TaxID=55513 RepID=UPI001263298E|nr:probable F-box protein At4g22030 [Pistacia vera]
MVLWTASGNQQSYNAGSSYGSRIGSQHGATDHVTPDPTRLTSSKNYDGLNNYSWQRCWCKFYMSKNLAHNSAVEKSDYVARRNQVPATQLFALRLPNKEDVKDAMEKVLALDQAYPLPLLGKMIEKFPKTFEPAVWWPSNHSQASNKKSFKSGQSSSKMEKNGWSEDLEEEMREIIEVLKRKDTEDYMRLGNLALKINKILAISGPLLTGIGAVGSAFVGSPHGSWAAVVAVAAGALATTVNTLEHGGQVGMVLEMYRYCAGSFTLLEESIEATLNESEVEKRVNGEMFVQNVALKLGRSISQLRDLAENSIYSRSNGAEIDEFASKLF